MMRVEAVHRPSNLVASADYCAIDINRQPPQTQLPDLIVEQLTIDPYQCCKRGLGEFLQPLHYRPIRRNARQTTQPSEQRIVRYIPQLLKPPRANHQKPDHQHRQVHAAVVTAEVVLTESLPNAMIQTNALEVAAQQLQPAIRSQLLAPEFNPQIPLDHPPQPRYPQPHQGPPVVLRVALSRTLINAWEASFFQSILLTNKKRFLNRLSGRQSRPTVTRGSISVPPNECMRGYGKAEERTIGPTRQH